MPDDSDIDPNHAAFEGSCLDRLRLAGMLVESTTFHWNPENCERRTRWSRRLKAMNDLNSILVRTTADRVLVHSVEGYSIHLEFKTNGGEYRNMAVEALPLALHRLKAHMGARCLYVYRDFVSGVEGCFWADAQLPPGCRIISTAKYRHLEPVLARHFPDIRIDYKAVRGSGDPYLVVHESRLKDFLAPDWFAEATTVPSDRRVAR